MNHDVGGLDIGFEHSEHVAAQRLEILLDLDLDIRPRQRAAQFVAVAAELVRHAGEKELYVRHSPLPALWPWPQCGMADRVRQRAGDARRAPLSIRSYFRESRRISFVLPRKCSCIKSGGRLSSPNHGVDEPFLRPRGRSCRAAAAV